MICIDYLTVLVFLCWVVLLTGGKMLFLHYLFISQSYFSRIPVLIVQYRQFAPIFQRVFANFLGGRN